MAIGMRQKRKGLFGGFDMPDPQGSPITPQQPVFQAGQGMEPEQQKPGLGTRLLGEGWGQRLAAMGSMLQGNAGAVANYHAGQQQMAAQEQAMQQRQAMAQQQRANSMEDWQAKEQWKLDNAQAKPDAFERTLAGAGIDPTSDEGRELYRARAASMASDPNDDFVVVPIPGVGTYAGPKSGMAAAMGGGGTPATKKRPAGNLKPATNGGPASRAPGGF